MLLLNIHWRKCRSVDTSVWTLSPWVTECSFAFQLFTSGIIFHEKDSAGYTASSALHSVNICDLL